MTVYVRGMEIQVSFISDNDGMTAKGFDLTWTGNYSLWRKVYLKYSFKQD